MVHILCPGSTYCTCIACQVASLQSSVRQEVGEGIEMVGVYTCILFWYRY